VITGSAVGGSGAGTGRTSSGGGLQGDLVAEGFELADVGAGLASGVEALVVQHSKIKVHSGTLGHRGVARLGSKAALSYYAAVFHLTGSAFRGCSVATILTSR
jgi:hypothetical protein